ncbi:hypothetical protein G6F56_005198 [Rhizopus delemar]|nr:hypothetical protein G6F56_005198 [Rhizopus delemar]
MEHRLFSKLVFSAFHHLWRDWSQLIYKNSPIPECHERAKQNLERETNITCDEVVAGSLAESSRKRKSEVVMKSSNKTFASKETLNEFNKINADHDNNRPLKSIPGAFNFYNEFLKLDDDDLIDKVANLPYEQNLFNKFMKFALMDYAINCERITPVPINDERTIFSENIVPLFKYFGNITKAISFRWNKGDTRLTDGIGSASFDSNFIVIESSGYNTTQSIPLTQEDLVKNLASATDILLGVMCKYDKVSINTMKKVNAYSAQVIQKKISLVRYSLKNRTTWKAVECGSAEIPLVHSDKRKMLKVLDLFAYVYHEIQLQKEYFDELESEHFELKELLKEDMVGPFSSFIELLR